MPIFRFKGIEKDDLKAVSSQIVAEVVNIINVPQDIVKIELLVVERITNTPPSLEILMFQRTKDTHDALAAKLHDLLSRQGYPNIHIYYILLDKAYYYKLGIPLES